MSYPEELARGERVGRKAHQCFDCYHMIPAGARHYFFTEKADDTIYTLRSHLDCNAASHHYTKVTDFDCWDGVPPLSDMISDGGEFQIDCDVLRGHFPHVVARLELSNQLAGIRYGETPST
ncbi:MAG: hypothetical protein Unbinned3138contig1000_60 [Prokaryotic dsDNA virus sp.]|nr:MAG: hypothetical protein Unbinned3138contig1000_60 [Prokaryotic dsDNA virus sp.]|tara:strand:- start:427 stop:789 length:363 start_codon:yes stop_codon:yes gene_type:complete